MTYVTKRATVTIWFPQKNMTLDFLQILTEYHTPSLARLESFSVNDILCYQRYNAVETN